MRVVLAVLLVALIVIATYWVIQWLHAAGSARRAKDPLRELSRRERREYVRERLKRQLDQETQEYIDRYTAMLNNTPIGVLPEKDK